MARRERDETVNLEQRSVPHGETGQNKTSKQTHFENTTFEE